MKTHLTGTEKDQCCFKAFSEHLKCPQVCSNFHCCFFYRNNNGFDQTYIRTELMKLKENGEKKEREREEEIGEKKKEDETSYLLTIC